MDSHTPLPIMHGFVVLGRDLAYLGGKWGTPPFTNTTWCSCTGRIVWHETKIARPRSCQEGNVAILVLFFIYPLLPWMGQFLKICNFNAFSKYTYCLCFLIIFSGAIGYLLATKSSIYALRAISITSHHLSSKVSLVSLQTPLKMDKFVNMENRSPVKVLHPVLKEEDSPLHKRVRATLMDTSHLHDYSCIHLPFEYMWPILFFLTVYGIRQATFLQHIKSHRWNCGYQEVEFATALGSWRRGCIGERCWGMLWELPMRRFK